MQTKGTERGSYFWIVLSFAAEVTAMLALVYWARRCSSLSGLTQNKPKKLLLYYLQAKLWLSEWSFTCHKRHKKNLSCGLDIWIFTGSFLFPTSISSSCRLISGLDLRAWFRGWKQRSSVESCTSCVIYLGGEMTLSLTFQRCKTIPRRSPNSSNMCCRLIHLRTALPRFLPTPVRGPLWFFNAVPLWAWTQPLP